MYGNDNPHLVDRFEDWWRRDNHGLPLMNVTVEKDGAVRTVKRPETPEQMYTDADYIMARVEEDMKVTLFYADSYAKVSGDFGPGSLALYLGTEPRFAWDTVWYEPSIRDEDRCPDISFREDNKWWLRHVELLKTLKQRTGGRVFVNIPDLIENLDIYAAMRGPVATLYDIMDDPERVEDCVSQIDDAYFKCYDYLFDLLKDENGVSSYTAFNILGKGRVAKVQCDFSAMISPGHYRRFVLPSLHKQVKKFDHSLYHLDGPDAIKHVPAIMELEELDALQWTCGAGQPDGGCEKWYPIYDQVREAKKGLWIQIYDGYVDDWIRGTDRIVDRYGIRSLYLQYPCMSERDADKLMNHAEKYWYEA